MKPHIRAGGVLPQKSVLFWIQDIITMDLSVFKKLSATQKRKYAEEPMSPGIITQFCYYIQQDESKRRATMHIKRKPAEQVEVDWAGDCAKLTDPDTGKTTDAYIFVGVMTYSQYAYVEAFPGEKQASWINAHISPLLKSSIGHLRCILMWWVCQTYIHYTAEFLFRYSAHRLRHLLVSLTPLRGFILFH